MNGCSLKGICKIALRPLEKRTKLLPGEKYHAQTLVLNLL